MGKKTSMPLNHKQSFIIKYLLTCWYETENPSEFSLPSEIKRTSMALLSDANATALL